MKRWFALFFAAALFLLPHAHADDTAPDVHADIISESKQVTPGSTFLIGVHFLIEEQWHIYWKFSGDAGFPTSVRWTLPKGVSISDLQWPAPEVFRQDGDINTAGYKNETALLASVHVPKNWPPNKPLTIHADVKWLVCKIACVPGGAKLDKRLAVGTNAIPHEREAALLSAYLKQVPPLEEEQKILRRLKEQPAPAAPAHGFATALLFAFIGGLLLNIMPCVLPVLSIKVFRLVKHADAEHKRVVNESLAYLAGVLLSFALLAATVIGLKSIGQQIGWGFQFQEPRFVIALIAILFVSGLAFLDFFQFSVLIPSALTQQLQQSGTAGALWDGFLATLLATPCTAPFLGAALGYSFSQPPAVILLFFLIIGLGLALPYVLFAVIPKTRRVLPKPGMWMQIFKEAMSFPLLGTVVWLLWVLGQQRSGQTIVAVLIFLLALTFALWGTKHWKGVWSRPFLILIVVLTYVFVVEPQLGRTEAVMPAAQGSSKWGRYSPQAVDELLAQKKTVFVDFTADWCLTCQLNKRVLHSARVTEAFQKADVVVLLADWTNGEKEITQTLSSLGRSGVPVYALYRPGDLTPVLLPELLTEKAVLDALKK